MIGEVYCHFLQKLWYKTLWNFINYVWNFVKFHKILCFNVIFLFYSAKDQKIFAPFGWNNLKILLNIYWILLTFIHAMQNEPNLWQLSLKPLVKFGRKVWNIFWTQPFGLGQISYHFIFFAYEIFRSAWISKLPPNRMIIQIF
jgi:hypothetical protein